VKVPFFAVNLGNKTNMQECFMKYQFSPVAPKVNIITYFFFMHSTILVYNSADV